MLTKGKTKLTKMETQEKINFPCLCGRENTQDASTSCSLCRTEEERMEYYWEKMEDLAGDMDYDELYY